MELNINENVLIEFGYSFNNVILSQIGSGLINRTFLLINQNQEKFILQNININVFKNPWTIAQNIDLVGKYLEDHYPDYLFIRPIKTINSKLMAVIDDEYWRLTPYVDNAVTFDVLSDPEQAFQAAKQFGKLTRLLNNFNTEQLSETIKNFHDLNLRFEQFTESLEITNNLNIQNQAKVQIDQALRLKYILDYYNSTTKRIEYPTRVIHHDTKISNVLLDEKNFEGKCVIDLDTLMTGKFISDLGDMMRTYLCAYSENEKDLKNIQIRMPFFEATIKGYLSEMGNVLTPFEKENILFSGKYIIYMQALRFLTDYLNGNIYYSIEYPEHNLDRTKNQFKLLTEIFDNEKELQAIIDKFL